MKSANYRNARYTARTSAFAGTTGLQSILTAMHGQQTANFVQPTRDMVARDEQNIQVLDAAAVPTVLYPFYLTFGRELFSLQGRISGPALAAEVANRKTLFVARGLDSAILDSIALDVFSISPPVSP